MSDKEIYQIIADELKTKNIDSALWIQAKGTAGGDPDKTEAEYIRLRFLDLIKSSVRPGEPAAALDSPKTSPDAKPAENELSRIRSELAKELLNHGKHSLYSTLKLHPDASDAVIAKAIEESVSKDLAGSEISPAELKYAIHTLGNPYLREQYDRQLLGSINNTAKSYRTYAAEEVDYEYNWWESRKTSIIIGVLSIILFGYLGLNFLKERNGSEIQKEAVESMKEAVHTTSDTEIQREQADIALKTEALRLAAERQNQDMEARARVADQISDQQRMAQENQRLAQENRVQADQQRQKAQQDQAENLRIMKEKQYWACMNQQLTVQLTQRYATSIDASSRCAMYR